MGRLDVEAKNLDRLLEAFAQLRKERSDVELHFYGAGDIRRMESLASRFGVQPHVMLHGEYDNRQDIPDIVRGCHFFVHPSRYEGGPCLSLLELVQAGRYVVASSVGGIPDLYEGHPEAGLLVDPSSVDSILEGLQTALHRLRNGMIRPELIRKRYDGHFDMESAHSAWSRIFLEEDSKNELAVP
jgi:glycosyltransferase involved in cell wall biosynthesis